MLVRAQLHLRVIPGQLRGRPAARVAAARLRLRLGLRLRVRLRLRLERLPLRQEAKAGN